jgi:hypothetical protein
MHLRDHERRLVPKLVTASLAHLTAALLDDEEAMLAIKTAQTVLHYLDPKLRGCPGRGR